MVEAYASKVADLSPQSFVSFLQAMAFGLQVQEDSETGSAVFEAIAAFAKHGVMCRMRGGQALGANEPSLLAVLLIIPLTIGLLFSGWQGYQDDDDDFFDTYDSRREDREITNRNRV